jgi:hypothetical protein
MASITFDHDADAACCAAIPPRAGAAATAPALADPTPYQEVDPVMTISPLTSAERRAAHCARGPKCDRCAHPLGHLDGFRPVGHGPSGEQLFMCSDAGRGSADEEVSVWSRVTGQQLLGALSESGHCLRTLAPIAGQVLEDLAAGLHGRQELTGDEVERIAAALDADVMVLAEGERQARDAAVADGRACVNCGRIWGVGEASRPCGVSTTGAQLFRCAPGCAEGVVG